MDVRGTVRIKATDIKLDFRSGSRCAVGYNLFGCGLWCNAEHGQKDK